MADELEPLEWDPKPAGGAPEPPGIAPQSDVAAQWPLPPLAVYARPRPGSGPLPCEVTGIQGHRSAGRLLAFDPGRQLALVQLPPARTPLTLRFDQFRSLTLTTPLPFAPPPPQGDPLSLVAQPQRTPYALTWTDGLRREGETVGHVQRPYGVFLFPPLDLARHVGRLFVPSSAWRELRIGSRLGEVLVGQAAAGAGQVEAAAAVQQQLRAQRIGDILVARQIVTPEQLVEALERQARMPVLKLGEVLTGLGMVSDADLHKALQQQQRDRGVALGELLVRMGFVTPEGLQEALARKMGYPLVDVDVFPAETAALQRVAYPLAARLRVLPLLERDGRLVVAIEDPARRHVALDEVEFSTQMKVVPVLARTRSMADAIVAAYRRSGGADGAAALADPSVAIPFDGDTGQLLASLEQEGAAQGADDGGPPIEQNDNSLVRLINGVIVEAWQDGVSDIHVETQPGQGKTRIRFRKDGRLRTHLELPPSYRHAVVARLKIMCNLDISEKRKPQDGKISFARFSAQHPLELRVATIPTQGGLEDVVLRLLASSRPIPLDQIGLSTWNLMQLRQAVERPHGLVLCVGPTGSGKTTTLHSVLSHLNRPERKIWTAEDPIEITQPGLRQVQVNPRIDWTFAKALRSFLRADPDVIMVGEIRDAETARVAIEASLTGHLVLSTLHTNSAAETVTRLLDMGMDPFNFADSLLAVLAQRLVRRLCPSCTTSRPATSEETDELLDDYLHAFGAAPPPVDRDALRREWTRRHGRDGLLHLHHGAGCEACRGSGFLGRTALHELLVADRELRRLVQQDAPPEQLQAHAARLGLRTLRQDGIEKVWAGLTTIGEVRASTTDGAPAALDDGPPLAVPDFPPLIG